MPRYCKPNGPYTPMVEFYPERVESDRFYIDSFELTPDMVRMEKMRSFRNYGEVRDLEAGRYVRLVARRGFSGTWMSDTPMERRTNEAFVLSAHGDVLIGGLGIGMLIPPLLERPDVTSITIIEIEEEVIGLVDARNRFDRLPFPDRLNIVHANMLEWVPPKGVTFHACWFDIWQDISADNHPEMKKLHLRFKNRLVKDGFSAMGSWRKEEVYRMAREDRRYA
jgi:spermidine synthase